MVYSQPLAKLVDLESVMHVDDFKHLIFEFKHLIAENPNETLEKVVSDTLSRALYLLYNQQRVKPVPKSKEKVIAL